MFKRLTRYLATAFCLLPALAVAHFQTLIPSHDLLQADTPRQVQLDMRFTHPMQGGPAMDMGKPVRFGVLGPDGHRDLRDALTPYQITGQTAYRADYRVTRPGDHLFYLQPAPYWEPAEGKMIEHFTKVVVDAFSGEPGWDRLVGFPVEIEPLTRPFGLWTGNLFQGVVRRDGEPVPFAQVEIEWLNDGSITPPADAYVTQVIKADANGTFGYALPRAGWWGFAALLEGPEKLRNPAGEPVPVEQGALIWVFARDMR
jgi:cobalt/nickel transport protein